MQRQTLFSPCRGYRYTLWREWPGGAGYAMFVGLNPANADEYRDDPTIRRCIGYARAWGYAALCMTNLFAWRAPTPRVLKTAVEPIGAENDAHLVGCARGAAIVVAAWGVHGSFLGRDQVVRQILPELHRLRLTSDGHPGHPLYLPKHLQPVPWPQKQSASDRPGSGRAGPRDPAVSAPVRIG